jgi:hypothetical protein
LLRGHWRPATTHKTAPPSAGERRGDDRSAAGTARARGENDMTEMPKNVVRLPPDLIAKCEVYAREVAAYYTSHGDDREACLPWSRDEFDLEYLRTWLASRKNAGRLIDIDTCEIGCWYAYDADPYGLTPDLSDEMKQIGKNRFVRSAESHGWVCEDDLPLEKVKAMYDRIEREYAA